MTKLYKILRKKLKELKAELIYVFSIPEEKNPYHQLLSEEIEQRFLFLKKLLSAEIASNPSKPHHLQHIAQRLNELETAFREWGDDHRRTSADVNNFDDSASICSCDESCRNDDGEAYDNNINDPVTVPDLDSRGEGLSFSEGLVDVNVEEQDSEKKIEADDDEGGKTTKQDKGSSYGGGILGGMIFGGVLTALIMSGFCSGCFYFAAHESFLVPT